MREEGQQYELQSAAQHIVAPRELQDEIKTHEQSGTTTRGGEYSMGVPCAATGTTLAPPTLTSIAMEQTIHTTAETEVTETTTATVTTPASDLKTMGTTAADTKSMKRTMDTETITAKASMPTPTLTTIMMAAADTQNSMDVMTMTTVGTIANQSMAEITMGTSEQKPTHMTQTTPP